MVDREPISLKYLQGLGVTPMPFMLEAEICADGLVLRVATEKGSSREVESLTFMTTLAEFLDSKNIDYLKSCRNTNQGNLVDMVKIRFARA